MYNKLCNGNRNILYKQLRLPALRVSLQFYKWICSFHFSSFSFHSFNHDSMCSCCGLVKWIPTATSCSTGKFSDKKLSFRFLSLGLDSKDYRQSFILNYIEWIQDASWNCRIIFYQLHYIAQKIIVIARVEPNNNAHMTTFGNDHFQRIREHISAEK